MHCFHALVLVDPFAVSPWLRRLRFRMYLGLSPLTFLGAWMVSIPFVTLSVPSTALSLLSLSSWHVHAHSGARRLHQSVGGVSRAA